MTALKWQPILQGPAEKSAWKYIEKLDKDIFVFEKNFLKEPAWIDNGIGASLFCFYLYKVSGEKQHLKRAESILNLTIENLSQNPSIDRLYSGFTGIAWVMEHFQKQKWPKGQDPNQEVDEYLNSKIRKGSAASGRLGMYSLVDDWVGYGVYGLERWPQGKTKILISNLVKFFDLKAKRTIQGATWYTTKLALHFIGKLNKETPPPGNFDLGLAHGVPGVIGFLAAVLKIDPDNKVAEDLLRSSINWLLAQDTGSPFIYKLPFHKKTAKEKQPPRLAWCYGDLGISIVLLNAGKALKDLSIKKKAQEIAGRAVRMSNPKAGVEYPCFCHGSSGAFHIFNRLYQNTGEAIFLNGALKWCDDIFQRVEDPTKPLEHGFDLLISNGGVGLSLIAGVSNVDPGWDRMLLIS